MKLHSETDCTADAGGLELGTIQTTDDGLWHIYQSITCSECGYEATQISASTFATEAEAARSAHAFRRRLLGAGLVNPGWRRA